MYIYNICSDEEKIHVRRRILDPSDSVGTYAKSLSTRVTCFRYLNKGIWLHS